jgi:hypothetical protein
MAEKDVFKEVMREPLGAVEAAAEGVMEGAAALGRGAGAVWDFVTGGPGLLDFGHGATEIMNAMYGSSAFTAYGWSQTSEGAEIDAPKTPDLGQEQDREIEM